MEKKIIIYDEVENLDIKVNTESELRYFGKPTEVITLYEPGPPGPKGEKGDTGAAGTISGSIFSGSFIGNGSGLTGIEIQSASYSHTSSYLTSNIFISSGSNQYDYRIGNNNILFDFPNGIIPSMSISGSFIKISVSLPKVFSGSFIGNGQNLTGIEIQSASYAHTSSYFNGNILQIFTASLPQIIISGGLMQYADTLANRTLPKIISNSTPTFLQPFLGKNKIGVWSPSGNSTTSPGIFGYSNVTTLGTVTVRSVTTSNMFTRSKRMGYVSATSINSFALTKVTPLQITLGTGTGLGGFLKIIRFGISDAVLVGNARTFIGISANSTNPSDVEPSTLTQHIGVGHGENDTNFKFYYGGNIAQTPIDFGNNFPCNTTNTDLYELALFSSPYELNTLYYQFNRLNTGHTTSGMVYAPDDTILPTSDKLMTYSKNWRSNNNTAVSVGLDIISDYIETDN